MSICAAFIETEESFTQLDVKTHTDVTKISGPQKHDYNSNNCNSYTLFYCLLLILNNDKPALASRLMTGGIVRVYTIMFYRYHFCIKKGGEVEWGMP